FGRRMTCAACPARRRPPSKSRGSAWETAGQRPRERSLRRLERSGAHRRAEPRPPSGGRPKPHSVSHVLPFPVLSSETGTIPRSRAARLNEIAGGGRGGASSNVATRRRKRRRARRPQRRVVERPRMFHVKHSFAHTDVSRETS